MKLLQTRRAQIIAVLLVAIFLRLWAAWQLPMDADEPVYLQAGHDYAEYLAAGDLNSVINYPINTEHPPLVKLLYGLGMLARGGDLTMDWAIYTGRLISAFFGVLAVWVVALIDPLAGLFMAVQTTVVKYTSEAYLEALPHFASLLAVLALLRSKAPRDRWFWISALALGLTAAGKYSYFPMLFVLVYLLLWEKKYPPVNLLPYLVLAGLSFWLLNPALWSNPANRLIDSIFFHALYSQGAHVQQIGYPWYQPFIWVARSMPYTWHPNVFFYFGFDGLIAILAVIAIPWEWRERRWVLVWIAVGMLFLLWWPTKWPQYSLVVLPAFCLAASQAARKVIARIAEEDAYWNWLRELIPLPSRGWVFAAVALAVVITLGQMFATVNQALRSRGWWQLTSLNTALPSNTIYDILEGPDGQMVLGSERGAVMLSLSPETNLPESWEVYTTANSGLPSNRVMALAYDHAGALWFGTQTGVSRLADGAWQTYRAAEIGLPSALVQALEVGSDGRLWIGSNSGIAVFDGDEWQTFTSANSDLNEDFVISLAIAPEPSGDILWVGTRQGLNRLDTASGEWADLSGKNTGINGGGVADLLVDSQGQLWVATLGGGLSLFDGESWSTFRVSNSDLPSNTVQKVFEFAPGIFWIATAVPTEVGGVLIRYDGENWRAFTPLNSGYSGGEPLALALDPSGRLWIGTRTSGVDIYQFNP